MGGPNHFFDRLSPDRRVIAPSQHEMMKQRATTQSLQSFANERPASRLSFSHQLLEFSIDVGDRTFKTMMTEGSSFDSILRQVVRENKGYLLEIDYPGLGKETVGIKIGDVFLIDGDPSKVAKADFSKFDDPARTQAEALAASMGCLGKGGVHGWADENGIPIAVSQDGKIMFLNFKEMKGDKALKRFKLSNEPSTFDPLTVDTLQNGKKENQSMADELFKKRSGGGGHAGERDKDVTLENAVVMIFDKNDGSLLSPEDFASKIRQQGFAAPQISLPNMTSVGLAIDTKNGIIALPMDGSLARIPYMFVRMFDAGMKEFLDSRSETARRTQDPKEWAFKDVIARKVNGCFDQISFVNQQNEPQQKTVQSDLGQQPPKKIKSSYLAEGVNPSSQTAAPQTLVQSDAKRKIEEEASKRFKDSIAPNILNPLNQKNPAHKKNPPSRSRPDQHEALDLQGEEATRKRFRNKKPRQPKERIAPDPRLKKRTRLALDEKSAKKRRAAIDPKSKSASRKKAINPHLIANQSGKKRTDRANHPSSVMRSSPSMTRKKGVRALANPKSHGANLAGQGKRKSLRRTGAHDIAKSARKPVAKAAKRGFLQAALPKRSQDLSESKQIKSRKQKPITDAKKPFSFAVRNGPRERGAIRNRLLLDSIFAPLERPKRRRKKRLF